MNYGYDSKEKVCNIFGEKEGENVWNIMNLAIPDEIKNSRLKVIVSNNLIKLRRKLRKYINELDGIYESRNRACKEISVVYSNKIGWQPKHIKRLKSYVQELENIIEEKESHLADCGITLYNLIVLYNFLATEHDFAQIINANIKQIVKCRQDFKKRIGSSELELFVNLILIYNVERENDEVFFRTLSSALLKNLKNKDVPNYEIMKGRFFYKARVSSYPQLDCGVMDSPVGEDLYLPIINLLNRKGYRVHSFCNGHLWQDKIESYIMFNEYMDDLELDIIPSNHIKEKLGYNIIFKRKYDSGLTEPQLYKQLLENALSVLEWAENLEELSY